MKLSAYIVTLILVLVSISQASAFEIKDEETLVFGNLEYGIDYRYMYAENYFTKEGFKNLSKIDKLGYELVAYGKNDIQRDIAVFRRKNIIEPKIARISMSRFFEYNPRKIVSKANSTNINLILETKDEPEVVIYVEKAVVGLGTEPLKRVYTDEEYKSIEKLKFIDYVVRPVGLTRALASTDNNGTFYYNLQLQENIFIIPNNSMICGEVELIYETERLRYYTLQTIPICIIKDENGKSLTLIE